MKSWSTPSASGKCKLKITVALSYLSEWLKKKKKQKRVPIPYAGEDAEKLDHSHIIGGNVKWCSHCYVVLAPNLYVQVPIPPSKNVTKFCGGEI